MGIFLLKKLALKKHEFKLNRYFFLSIFVAF